MKMGLDSEVCVGFWTRKWALQPVAHCGDGKKN